MKLKINLLILLALVCSASSAQTISMYFPHFAGSEYVFFINKGSQNDTIQAGTLGSDGRLSITLPNKNNYIGMGHWMLNSGGGLSIVINKEDISVKCTEPTPNDNNIIFEGSDENLFIMNQYFLQQQLLHKINLMDQGEKLYKKTDSIYPVFAKELAELNNSFESLQKETAQSNLYAAKYRRISDFLGGIGKRMYKPGEEAVRERDMLYFITDELDMSVLYTSGLWNYVLSSSFEMYTDKDLWAADMVKILKRTNSPVVYESFANDILAICETNGLKNPEDTIVAYLVKSKQIKNPQDAILRAFQRKK